MPSPDENTDYKAPKVGYMYTYVVSSYACKCIHVHVLEFMQFHALITLNGSSDIQHFEHSDAIKIPNGILFNFYTALPHMYTG